ncbi:hypothetical protein Tco_0802486 [Tanacetum coccineum]|uniref:Reverse transcriptase domain-containing protein n=1 Tax=Tanacetum coccineum TaxID=301880 RepID=A0ABQ4ZZ37_9ASTR
MSVRLVDRSFQYPVGIAKCKIQLLDDKKPVVQKQRRLNPNMQEVVKKEIMKLLDTGIIYPIFDSPWVSPIHCVPKKGGIIVVQTKMMNVSQLEPLRVDECMLAIFHDMIEESIEVFMDDFSVFGNSFDKCLNNLDKKLQRTKMLILSLIVKNVTSWSKKELCLDTRFYLRVNTDLEVDQTKSSILGSVIHFTLVVQLAAGGRTASPGNILENLRKLVVLYLFPYAFPLLLGGISVLKRCLASLAMYLELFEQEINCQRESLSYVLSFEKVKVSFRKEMNKFLIEYDQGVSSNQSWINDVETTQFSALGLC